MTMIGHPSNICNAVTRNLTPDLLSAKEREKLTPSDDPTTGHCYVAAEALYHALGGAPWRPEVLNHKAWPQGLKRGETHWYLRNTLNRLVYDPTMYQFESPVPYHKGKGCGFLTKAPSLRAAILLQRLRNQQVIR
jgi:hypothetical protein